jgi:hypothetical protein
VVKGLIRLFAHQDRAISDLEQCRINPDFTSIFRNDLEFYIPQMCCFYLKGEFEKLKELNDIMVVASSTSFFFSHRMWFFFQAEMFSNFEEDHYKMSRRVLNELREVVYENSECMYIANSKVFTQKASELELDQFYSQYMLDKIIGRFYASESEKEK